MKYKYNTGGRENYYKCLHVRDCVTRALAISCKMDYKEAYKLMWKFQGDTPRNGCSQKATNECFMSLGWKYTDLEKKDKKLLDFEDYEYDVVFRVKTKKGNFHLVAYIDGTLNDTWNCTWSNPKVVGYWKK